MKKTILKNLNKENKKKSKNTEDNTTVIVFICPIPL